MKDLAAVKERRRATAAAGSGSVTVLRAAKLITAGGQLLCLIRTLSPTGASADLEIRMEAGERLFVEISGQRIAATVAKMEHHRVVLDFEAAVDVQAILAGGLGTETGQRRTAPRVDVDCRARLQLGAQAMFVTIRDISTEGLRLESDELLFQGDEVAISLRGWGKPIPGTVRWTDDDLAGVSFHEPLAMRDLTQWLASAARPASDGSADSLRKMARQ